MGKIGARKNSSLKAICTAPSFNKTPVGGATPPLPYPTVQDLGNSASVARSVNFNEDPAYVLSRSKQPRCKGDNPGILKGIRSNTVNGYVMPKNAAKHFRAEGKYVVRQGDRNVMNGGNNPGIYITMQMPSMSFSVAAANSHDDNSPPVQPETAAEGEFLANHVKGLESLGAMEETGKLLASGAAASVAGILLAPCAGFIPGMQGNE